MNQLKSKVFGIVAALALCLGISFEAHAHIYQYQVLHPDGKPAVGAKVQAFLSTSTWEIRSFVHQKVRVLQAQTDTRGIATVESEGDKEELAVLIVDEPGYNLSLLYYPNPKAEFLQLVLESEQPIVGKVLDQWQQPVADATVITSIVGGRYSNDLFLQDPRQVQFPGLTTKTNADGSFLLRRSTLNKDDTVVLWVIAKGKIYNAMGSLRTGGEKPIVIEIKQNVSIRGQVVHYATGKPLSGAQVRYWDEALPQKMVVTDAEGRFAFNDLPANLSRKLDIFHAEFPRVSMTISTIPETFNDRKFQSEIVIGLRPEAKVTGKVIDETTKRPLPFSIRVSANFIQELNGWTHSVKRETQTNAKTGEFSLMAPVGSLRVQLEPPYDPGWTSGAVELGSRPLEVPLNGVQNVSLEVRKKPGCWIHFESNDPTDHWQLYAIDVKNLTAKSLGDRTYIHGRQLFIRAERWGDIIEIRGEDVNRKEILPTMTIVADPKNWPFVIQIPEKKN